MAIAAVANVPLIFAPTIGSLAGLLALAGLPVATQWATSYLTLDAVAPKHAAGEAMS